MYNHFFSLFCRPQLQHQYTIKSDYLVDVLNEKGDALTISNDQRKDENLEIFANTEGADVNALEKIGIFANTEAAVPTFTIVNDQLIDIIEPENIEIFGNTEVADVNALENIEIFVNTEAVVPIFTVVNDQSIDNNEKENIHILSHTEATISIGGKRKRELDPNPLSYRIKPGPKA